MMLYKAVLFSLVILSNFVFFGCGNTSHIHMSSQQNFKKYSGEIQSGDSAYTYLRTNSDKMISLKKSDIVYTEYAGMHQFVAGLLITGFGGYMAFADGLFGDSNYDGLGAAQAKSVHVMMGIGLVISGPITALLGYSKMNKYKKRNASPMPLQ